MPSSADLYPSILAQDEDGRHHTLRVLPGLRGVRRPSDPTGRIPGPKRIVLEGGGEVQRVAKGVYLTPWAERLVSDDPDAP
jgi:hypothetical protein